MVIVRKFFNIKTVMYEITKKITQINPCHAE